MRLPRAVHRVRVSASIVVLAAIVLAGLLVRLVNIDHGLPFVFHPDEANHFTSFAVGMFRNDLDPGYYQNPSAYTYSIYLLLRAQYSARALVDPPQNVVRDCLRDPSGVYLTARVLAAVLCMSSVVAIYAVGRRLWSTTAGLAAAAVLAFAFLPVAYSRFALTDVAALMPATIALYCAVRAHETGRLRYFALGGAAVGLAVGFKYTTGLLVAPFVAASLLSARGRRALLPSLATFGGVAFIAFFITNPYVVIHLDEAIDQLRAQNVSANRPKLGLKDESGALTYLRSLTWGLGWGAMLAAAVGAVWEWRRNWSRALILLLFPLLLFAFLSTAERFFARWFMPAYPALALLAGVALARFATRLSPRPAVQYVALAALLGAVLVQPLAADVRTARLLGRNDTREMTWEFLVRSLPNRTRVVVEPALPTRVVGRWLSPGFTAPPRRGLQGPAPARFVRSRHPALIDVYRATGYCYIVSFSSVRRRIETVSQPNARAYYRRLEAESTVIFRGNPYRDGVRSPSFDLDKTQWLYYAPFIERPGPEAVVYRLNDCRPAQAPPSIAAIARAARTSREPDPVVRIARPVSGPSAADVCGQITRPLNRGDEL
jgi:hypothetical protein